MKIARHFTRFTTAAITEKSDQWTPARIELSIPWKTFQVSIKEGKQVILEGEVEAPASWSQTATEILAHKYLRKAGVPSATVPIEGDFGTPDFTLPRWLVPKHPALGAKTTAETSAKQVFRRLAGAWTYHAWIAGYFGSVTDPEALEIPAQNFYDECFYILANQIAAPNSPQWFNTGIWWAYGITGNTSHAAFRAPNIGAPAQEIFEAYKNPQTSACFILGLKDSLLGDGGILNTIEREARIFKYGSGSGVNYSTLRAKGAPLGNGGTSSGMMSFLKMFDTNAGTIKSGGTTRRAARMAIVNADHPEAEAFVEWKAKEEVKVAAMAVGAKLSKPSPTDTIAQAVLSGLNTDYEGDAYQTVSGQNANNSLRVSNAFMENVQKNGERLALIDTKQAVLWQKTVEAAHACGDPGLQFHDTINDWHTTPKAGAINASNPCQPGFATVLTPTGIRTFDDIEVGSVIWSGNQWTKVKRKISTGIKPVLSYRTNAGTFIGTENHRVLSSGERVEAKDAETIDIACGPVFSSMQHSPQAIMDGLLLGDGSLIHANGGSNEYIVLNIGEFDGDYLRDPSLASLLAKNVYDQRGTFHSRRADTTLHSSDFRKLWERRIPNRYMYAPTNEVASFLRGLFSANGAVIKSGKRVTLKTSSPELRDQVISLLSSLGIPSYATTNSAKPVQFNNGEYVCKENYDVNITRGRYTFADVIGFVQIYKQRALADTLEARQQGNRSKLSFEVINTELLGEFPVWDIEVEAKEHTYWTGGLLVSNCSEYMFLDDSSCNLASMNLIRFWNAEDDIVAADDASTEEHTTTTHTFDTESYLHTIRLLTVVLDVSVGMSSFPDRKVAENSVNYRAIGLGYANLGGLLMAMGIPYGSRAGRTVCGVLTAVLHGQAWATSREIADELGAFHEFEKHTEDVARVLGKHRAEASRLADRCTENDLGGDATASALDSLVTEFERLWGVTAHVHKNLAPTPQFTLGGDIRNAQLTLLAPTGTIGLVMDCATTGIEPDFSLIKTKKLAGGGTITMTNPLIGEALAYLGYKPAEVDAILAYVKEMGRVDMACPDIRREHMSVFACANDLSVEGHLGMMQQAQPFLSGAISKTVNLPNTATVSDVSKAYLQAWQMGLKAVAIYRDGCKLSQPLVAKTASVTHLPQASEVPLAVSAGEPVKVLGAKSAIATRYKLPSRRRGFTQKVKIGGQSLYLRTGEYADGSLGELFLDMGRAGSTLGHLLSSIAIAISLGRQHGVPLQEYIDAFKDSKSEPSGIVQDSENVRMCSSIMDYIVKELEAEYVLNSRMQSTESVEVEDTPHELLEGGPVALPEATPTRAEKVVALRPVALSVPEAIESMMEPVMPEVSVTGGPVANGKLTDSGHIVGLRTLARPRYIGDACNNCGEFTLRRSGTCHVCDSCGETSGCS